MDIVERNRLMLLRRDEGASLAAIGREFGLSTERARTIVLKARRLRDDPRKPRPDGRPHLSTSTRNSCINAIWTATREQLDWKSTDDEITEKLRLIGLLENNGEKLLGFHYIGPKTLNELREHLG